MELEEVVTTIINYIDESAIKTKRETIQEVNVLMEHQRSQFATFCEGLDTLRDQMNRGFDEIDKRFDEMNRRFDQNDSEHHNMKMMITKPLLPPGIP